MAKERTSASVAKPKANENNEWIKVTNEKAKSKAKKRIHPSVIVTSSKDKLSYTIPIDSDFKDLSGNVNRI